MEKNIKQLIEEEAKKHADFTLGEDTTTLPYEEMVLYCSDNGFKAGANFILQKWQASERWRKVEEELPEMGFRVLIKNEFNVIQMGYIDTVGDWRYCLDNTKIKVKIIAWKPIND